MEATDAKVNSSNQHIPMAEPDLDDGIRKVDENDDMCEESEDDELPSLKDQLNEIYENFTSSSPAAEFVHSRILPPDLSQQKLPLMSRVLKRLFHCQFLWTMYNC